ncbi:hypothetical protein M8J76_007766 [Diaphorina citri]|nr:hypothetical protein M8J76_007766 [Diaphorina citri]
MFWMEPACGPKVRKEVFATFKVSPLETSQDVTADMTLPTRPVTSSTPLPPTRIVVSSAKSTNFTRGSGMTMSLMYSRNNSGPSTDPCGTPDRTGRGEEKMSRCTPDPPPGTLTLWCLPER